ncbi:MAG: ribose 5-phosphate isomerase B [Candidatus Goldbacteria bacterium]|nr:ribose 5-phosphate isomerase B [Candidatus Goldiibacteriota bacterium]
MRIALGSDHAGWFLKEEIKKYMSVNKIDFKDFGTYNKEPCDYPDYALKVCEAILSGSFDRGILFCGTGIGMCIAANKIRGIFAALCDSTYAAYFAKRKNNSNVLVLPGSIVAPAIASEIVKIWLETEFEGGRHEKRINKIKDIEARLF